MGKKSKKPIMSTNEDKTKTLTLLMKLVGYKVVGYLPNYSGPLSL